MSQCQRQHGKKSSLADCACHGPPSAIFIAFHRVSACASPVAPRQFSILGAAHRQLQQCTVAAAVLQWHSVMRHTESEGAATCRSHKEQGAHSESERGIREGAPCLLSAGELALPVLQCPSLSAAPPQGRQESEATERHRDSGEGAGLGHWVRASWLASGSIRSSVL